MHWKSKKAGHWAAKRKAGVKRRAESRLYYHGLFSRSTVTTALYDEKNQWFIVNASSASRAEEVLSLVRKALGSLPALPWIDNNQLNMAMQQWLTNQNLPAGFSLGHEAELKAPDEEGAKVKFSNHLLTADEVQSHLEDKLVTKLEFALEGQLNFIVCDDGSLKKLRFHEMLANQNDELGWDDMVLRLDADLLVMANEVAILLQSLRQAVGQP